MSEYYLDASALVKRYAPEQGSAWVSAVTAPDSGHTLLISEITLVEVSAAMAAKARASSGISIRARDEALSRFLQDCDQHYVLLQIDRPVLETAVTLVLRHRLRAYDAMQLSTAVVANSHLAGQGFSPLAFVSADTDLLAAARSEGLVVENPLDHCDV